MNLLRSSTRRSKAMCRKGRHQFGAAQMIGGGIGRRVCDSCGAVSIDLTEADEPTGADMEPTGASNEHARGS